jgi:hypothetical protein
MNRRHFLSAIVGSSIAAVLPEADEFKDFQFPIEVAPLHEHAITYQLRAGMVVIEESPREIFSKQLDRAILEVENFDWENKVISIRRVP